MSVVDDFYSARSVVLIGASRKPGRLGHTLANNLTQRGYPGEVYFVNPKGGELFSRPIYASVGEIGRPIDMAVILVPPAFAAAAVAECGQAGIERAIVATGGFSELGEEGRKLELHMRDQARAHGVRLIGPNCIGIIDAHRPLDTTFLASDPVKPGPIGLVSQSGALCASLIDQLRDDGPGFSRMASLGNSADVNAVDTLESFGRDPNTRVILMYLESIRDGRRLVDAARGCGKPVIALKVGRSEAAQKAAQSHTGALAGNDRLVEAAFRRAGIVRADSIRELVQFGAVAAMSHRLSHPTIAVLSNAGGPSVAATDAAANSGLSMASLSDATHQLLVDALPPAASTRNPVDALASAGPDEFGGSLMALLRDANVSGVVVIAPQPPGFDAVDVAKAIRATSEKFSKPVVVVFMGDRSMEPARDVLRAGLIPVFDYPEDAVRALAKTLPVNLPTHLALPSPVSGLENEASGWLSYGRSLEILAENGLPAEPPVFVPRDFKPSVVADAPEGPFAIKVQAPSALHKTDVDGVALGLADTGQADDAMRSMMERIVDAEGVWLETMASPGADIIVGGAVDPHFGPFVMAGGGGTGVEEDPDVAFELAPVTEEQALEMLIRTRAGRALRAGRGRKAMDRRAAAAAIAKLSQLVASETRIQEIEINPLRVFPSGARSLDARIRLI